MLVSEVFLLYGHGRQQCFLSVFVYIVFVLLANWGWDV